MLVVPRTAHFLVLYYMYNGAVQRPLLVVVQAHLVIHQPVSAVSQCGAGAWLNGLASGDQRRLTLQNSN